MAHTVKYTTEMVTVASNNCPLFKEAFEGFTPDQKYRAARAALAIAELRAATEALERLDDNRDDSVICCSCGHLDKGRKEKLEAKIKEYLDAAVSLGLEKNHGMGIAKRLNTVVNVDSERYLFGDDGKEIKP